jgi:hypothetical protein
MRMTLYDLVEVYRHFGGKRKGRRVSEAGEQANDKQNIESLFFLLVGLLFHNIIFQYPVVFIHHSSTCFRL